MNACYQADLCLGFPCVSACRTAYWYFCHDSAYSVCSSRHVRFELSWRLAFFVFVTCVMLEAFSTLARWLGVWSWSALGFGEFLLGFWSGVYSPLSPLSILPCWLARLVLLFHQLVWLSVLRGGVWLARLMGLTRHVFVPLALWSAILRGGWRAESPSFGPLRLAVWAWLCLNRCSSLMGLCRLSF